MFAFLMNVVVISVVMWVIFKFMYPKPPKHFFPKEGDDTTERTCDFCGHSLATYRGILEKSDDAEHFFCNDAHKASFEAGERYQG